MRCGRFWIGGIVPEILFTRKSLLRKLEIFEHKKPRLGKESVPYMSVNSVKSVITGESWPVSWLLLQTLSFCKHHKFGFGPVLLTWMWHLVQCNQFLDMEFHNKHIRLGKYHSLGKRVSLAKSTRKGHTQWKPINCKKALSQLAQDLTLRITGNECEQ